MKILQLDVDNITYELVKPESRVHEEAGKKRVSVDNAIAILVSVEKGDDAATAKEAMKDVSAFMAKQGRKKLMIYPFAHLSRDLASPEEAQRILNDMCADAPEGAELKKAPFGWNKKLSVSVKGHPLAEQSRSYGHKPASKAAEGENESKHPRSVSAAKSEVKESAALKEEDKVISTWYVLDPDKGLVPVDGFDFKNHVNLKKFADYEIKKVGSYAQEPPHIRLMQRLELVDYEPGSDPGNMRFYPNGRLVKSLIEQYVNRRVTEYGAAEVETPIMYAYDHPALKEYLDRFPARHYIVKSDDKDYFLRFAACFGQFLMMHDATISYRNLPLKVYELARYSFRREKSGELAGLKRLRAFTMPDMHSMCADLASAENEFDKQFKFCQSVLSGIGIGTDEYEAAVRFTEGFWKDHKDFVLKLVKEYLKKPALIEMWNFRYAYFDPKFEFNVIDASGKAAALSTVQIDHENGKRYGLKYRDKDGEQKTPVILHCSPSGAIERVIHTLLELAYIKQEGGGVPALPLWLSPTQVRLLPLSDKFVKDCIELAEKLKSKEIRVDIDDKDDTLGKKIGNAEKDWVPYICVVGEKELSSDKLAVRIRKLKKQEHMSLEDLESKLAKELDDMPRSPLTLNLLLSKRPIFKG